MTWDLPFIGDDKPKLGISAEPGLPEKEAAHLEVIGHDQNKNSKMAPALIVVNGGAVNLDSLCVRQVIFEASEIHYSSKPVILESVVFFDCRFVLENDSRGRDLAERVLESPRVSWRASSASLSGAAALTATLPTAGHFSTER
jgi:hypothetical protein